MTYTLWHKELRHPTPEEHRLQRTTTPSEMSGYWRIVGARTKPDYPVAIWTADGETDTIIQIGRMTPVRTNGRHDDKHWQEFANGSWLHCIAVTEDEYHRAMDDKGPGKWDDGKPARQLTADQKLGLDIPTTPAEQGGNMPPEAAAEIEHEQIVEKIEALVEKANAIGKIDSIEKANEAAAIIEPLRGLGTRGEARRKSEKQPHLEAAAAVDAKWSAVRLASEAVKVLLDAVDGFRRAEKRRLEQEEAERQRKERARIAEENRQRLEAEAAERRRIAEAEAREPEPQPSADDMAAEAERIAAETVVPVKVEAPRVGTAFGRGVSKPKIKSGTITDIDLFFGAIKTQADVVEFLQKKANALARANVTLPGMEIDRE